jgi:rhodanese-related sulfurtransferase
MNSEITREELAALMAGQRPPTVVEALDLKYYESGHLPGAIPLPLGSLQAVARRRLPNKTELIVTYCASATCKNSTIAARALKHAGYQSVRIYVGGKADWRTAGLPLESGPEAFNAMSTEVSP